MGGVHQYSGFVKPPRHTIGCKRSRRFASNIPSCTRSCLFALAFLATIVTLTAPLASCKQTAGGNGEEQPTTPLSPQVAVTSVTLSSKTLSLKAGGSASLSASIAPANASNKSITWKSSDTSEKIIVSDTGVVTVEADAAIGHSATITVTTADGGFTDTCAVTVSSITEISEVHAILSPLELGKSIGYGVTYTYTKYVPSVTGTPATLIASNSTYGWKKFDGSEWKNASGTTCTAGMYRIDTQVRIDGDDATSYKLAEKVKVFVSTDGGENYDAWEVGTSSNYETYSSAGVTSIVYAISDGTEFSALDAVVPKSYVGKGIDSVAIKATGGTPPYTFAVSEGALPAGVSLDTSTGIISGTPTAAQAAQSVTVTVTDSASAQKTVTVSFGEVSANKVVAFNGNWRGTSSVAQLDVAAGSAVAKPADPTPENSLWSFDCWCTDQYGDYPYDFDMAVTNHLTLYAKWHDLRPEISEVEATMPEPVAGEKIPSRVTYTYIKGSPARFNDYGWQVKVGDDTYEDTKAGDVFESGKTYKLSPQVRIDAPGSAGYRLASSITVTVNGKAWTVNNPTGNYTNYSTGVLYSYVWVTSPEYTVE